MGMYTEINIGIELRQDVPEMVVGIIQGMLRANTYNDTFIPPLMEDHELFKTARWRHMLISGSYYFDGKPNYVFRYDDNGNSWYLTVRSNLKNYDDEIRKFLDWIFPYTQSEGFIGYFRYENDLDPTLIYFDTPNKKIKFKRVVSDSELGVCSDWLEENDEMSAANKLREKFSS